VSGKRARPRRRSGGHAQRSGTPLRKRIGGRLPSPGRVLALLIFAATVAGLVAAVNGPWLRITNVAHTGQRYTSTLALDEIMAGYRGQSLLGVDAAALQTRLTSLPAVADASVAMRLPGELAVTVTEKPPAFVWRTPAVQLIGAADGTVMAELPLDTELEADLHGLPAVSDERQASRGWTIGDVLNDAEVRVALRLVALDPQLIGSQSEGMTLNVDDEFGFTIASSQPTWLCALGFYELDPREDQAAADARLERQLAAIRTLFSTRNERAVSWLDARNPGKVYWAP
jgi:hypothetical protein